jgi:hypothetical protein
MCAPVGSMSSVPLENGDFGQYNVLKTNESFIVSLYNEYFRIVLIVVFDKVLEISSLQCG